MTRLALAITTCTAIPVMVVLAFRHWKNNRLELSTWRNGAGLTAMFIVFALWLIQAARWGAIAAYREFTGFLGPNWTEVETFLPAFYALPGTAAGVSFEGFLPIADGSRMVPVGCLLPNILVRHSGVTGEKSRFHSYLPSQVFSSGLKSEVAC